MDNKPNLTLVEKLDSEELQKAVEQELPFHQEMVGARIIQVEDPTEYVYDTHGKIMSSSELPTGTRRAEPQLDPTKEIPTDPEARGKLFAEYMGVIVDNFHNTFNPKKLPSLIETEDKLKPVQASAIVMIILDETKNPITDAIEAYMSISSNIDNESIKRIIHEAAGKVEQEL